MVEGPSSMAGGAGSPVIPSVDVRAGPIRIGEPVMRWNARAHSIEEIERQLAAIWAIPKLTTTVDGVESRRIAARTSVMNLVVIARRAETGQGAAATIAALSGKHPSRTLVVSTADPDGPTWLDAQIQAHCILPREDAPETCAEFIYLTCGGEGGRHLDTVVAPLLVHDLPVAVWWPGEPMFAAPYARELVETANRVIVDGSHWSGDGMVRLRQLAGLIEEDPRLGVWDFALVRQARWREAIASTFDMPEFLPFVHAIKRIAVGYATHDESDEPGRTNIVKPVYHVAWLGSRLDMKVERPLTPAAGKRGGGRGLLATLRRGRTDVAVVMRPMMSSMPTGTTLRVELLAERRGSELRVDVTAEAHGVRVRAWQDGVDALERGFKAHRKTDVELLEEAIEAPGRDPVACDAIGFAAELGTALAGAAAERR